MHPSLPSRTVTFFVAMYGIKEIAEILGLSEKQVRRRLSLIFPHLDGHCRKGPRGKILVDERGLELLREMVLRERSGSSVKDAAASVLELLQGTNRNGQSVLSGPFREGTERCGKEGEALQPELSRNSEPNEQHTFPHIPGKMGKERFTDNVLWLIAGLLILSVLLQIVILVSLYLT